jgi:hypothetical protein
LARLCSTPELHPLIYPPVRGSSLNRGSLFCGDGCYMAQSPLECNRKMTPLRIEFHFFTWESSRKKPLQTNRYSGCPKANIFILGENGAGEAIRTLDPNLGKVVLYP